MKAVKGILIVIGILLVVIIIANSMAPAGIDMARSVVIDATNDIVWEQINSLEDMNNWGPWKDMDPDAEYSVEGADGEIGATSSWKGEIVGEGSQTITAIKVKEEMVVDLVFIEDGREMKAIGNISMEDTEDGKVEVTWGFNAEFPWMMRGMIMMMADETEMNEAAADFEKGLANLKELCEGMEMEEESMSYEVMAAEREAVRYIGVRGVVSHDDIGAHFQELMPQIGEKAGPMMTGPPAGLFWTWDEENKTTDMAVAGTVAEGEVEGMEAFEIEGGKALHVAYYGWYGDSEGAHNTIDEYMKTNEIEFRDVVIEEYITDPGQEPDTAKWLTDIYYMIK